MEQVKGISNPTRPVIPSVLVEATKRALKAGMKPDEFAKTVEKQEETTAQQPSKSAKEQQGHMTETLKDELDGDDEPERTYRNFDERRMGFLISADHHRFGGGFGEGRLIYCESPPLDFSFCALNKIEEIVTENEEPQKTRSFKLPPTTSDGRFKTSSLRLSYNVISDIDGLINILYKILDGGPFGLCWLDLSFNGIAKLDMDTFEQLTNLKILYLHGNSIVDMTEVPKLKVLKNLMELTMHGNPIEEEDGYWISMLYYFPNLTHLDFIAITKSDLITSQLFGYKYEDYWKQRSVELEESYQQRKKAEEITYTEELMAKEMNYASDEEIED